MSHQAAETPAPYVLGPKEGDELWFLGNLVTLKAVGGATHGGLTVAEFLNPPAFAPPLHRHRVEDEMFYLLEGTAVFHCAGRELPAGPGDFVYLPRGEPHTFIVGPRDPLRCLQLTTPAGFEHFAAQMGEPAAAPRLPDPAPVNPAALGHAAALHHIDILGPPPAAG